MTSKVWSNSQHPRAIHTPFVRLQNLATLYGCTVRAANNLVELWKLKAAVLEDGQFFESAVDFSVRFASWSARRFADLCVLSVGQCFSSVSGRRGVVPVAG